MAIDAAVGDCDVVTTLLYDKRSTLGQLVGALPRRLRTALEAELSRRAWLEPGRAGVVRRPLRELLRLACTKSGLSRLMSRPQQMTDWVFSTLDEEAARLQRRRGGYALVYAYEDCAQQTFEEAKRHGALCLYDLPILFYRAAVKIQSEEAERFPELRPSLAAANEPEEKLRRKDEEIRLADHIFVASSATRTSLVEAGVEPGRVSVIPYGAPNEYFVPQVKPGGPFRALFVGRVGPRKGVHYLLRAWSELKLKSAELELVGINEFPPGWLERQGGGVRYRSSVPHQSLGSIYSSANVFVFPSLVDGFGMVLLEAMACGVPVITTPNTAGPDIVESGKDGFIVPIRDAEALKERLDWCASHPKELEEMGRAARKKAEEYTWAKYRSDLSAKIQTLINP